MHAPRIALLLALVTLVGCGNAPREASHLAVPFTSQAPAGDWSEPWQNACEETSIAMVDAFYSGRTFDAESAPARIKEVLATKERTSGASDDESTATIAAIVSELDLAWYGETRTNVTADDLRRELADGHPVIVPVYAPALGVSYADAGAVDYHVLVLTGYDAEADAFIANDPGTQQGEGVRFPVRTFMAAIHDLDQEHYERGPRSVLVTRKKLLP
jgi:hypothetical protein